MELLILSGVEIFIYSGLIVAIFILVLLGFTAKGSL